jgi:hypothetical protein
MRRDLCTERIFAIEAMKDESIHTRTVRSNLSGESAIKLQLSESSHSSVVE